MHRQRHPLPYTAGLPEDAIARYLCHALLLPGLIPCHGARMYATEDGCMWQWPVCELGAVIPLVTSMCSAFLYKEHLLLYHWHVLHNPPYCYIIFHEVLTSKYLNRSLLSL